MPTPINGSRLLQILIAADDQPTMEEFLMAEMSERHPTDRLPARAALASHKSAILTAQTAVDDTEAPLLRLKQAEGAFREAEAELAKVIAKEAEDLRAWASGGTIIKDARNQKGPMPSPRTEERRAAAERVADAKSQLEAARLAATEFEQAHTAAKANLVVLNDATPQLIASVLEEEAKRLAAVYLEAGERALQVDAALNGIADALIEQGYGARAGGVLALRNISDRKALDEKLFRLRSAAKALASRLDTNYDAAIDAIR